MTQRTFSALHVLCKSFLFLKCEFPKTGDPKNQERSPASGGRARIFGERSSKQTVGLFGKAETRSVYQLRRGARSSIPTLRSGLRPKGVGVVGKFMKAFVYILKDDRSRYYIGSTTDLTRRLNQHKYKHTQTTSRMLNPRLVLQQEYVSIEEARKIERKLKKLKRKDYIEKIVSDGHIKMNPQYGARSSMVERRSVAAVTGVRFSSGTPRKNKFL